jgi:pimeloyl-ACP methyl ester carboxylesterase
MKTKYFDEIGLSGCQRLAYYEWGDTRNDRVVVCVHGLTRNGRDFDALAQHLSPYFRVVCPDMPGRGKSQWLPNPMDYGYPLYMGIAGALVARLGVKQIDWVGTSMGGLIGMIMASQSGSPVRRLVLNDVGPFIPQKALERIVDYVGKAPKFNALGEAEHYLRQVHASFGPLSEEQWRHLAVHSTRALHDRTLALHYDPAIALALRAVPSQDVDLWALWDSVRSPTLVLRGSDSDVLSFETTKEMMRRGPRVKVVEVQGVGHAPALMDDDQINAIKNWLLE